MWCLMFTNSLGKFVLTPDIMKNKCARKESMWKPISFLKPKVISRVAKKNQQYSWLVAI